MGIGWYNRADVLMAFKIVGEEIRTKCQRFAANGFTQGEACQLASRIKEQRELIRQLARRRNVAHARRLMRLNRALRNRLIRVARQAGLETSVLIFK